MAMPIQTRESGFKTNPDYRVTLEPSPRRVRVKFNGEIIADSTNAHLLFETGTAVYYFPRSDAVRSMTPTIITPSAPQGDSVVLASAVGDAWRSGCGAIGPSRRWRRSGMSSLYWDRVDAGTRR